jgi:hypothetical protein
VGVQVFGTIIPNGSPPLPNPPPTSGRSRPSSTGYGGRERESFASLTLILGALLLLSTAAIAQTFTPRDENPEEFPAGAGRDETFYACTACHNFKLVAAQGLTRAGWEDSINLMVRRHNMPPLDDKDRAVVLNYLEATYPPRAPAGGRGGWQNPFSKQ